MCIGPLVHSVHIPRAHPSVNPLPAHPTRVIRRPTEHRPSQLVPFPISLFIQHTFLRFSHKLRILSHHPSPWRPSHRFRIPEAGYADSAAPGVAGPAGPPSPIPPVPPIARQHKQNRTRTNPPPLALSRLAGLAPRTAHATKVRTLDARWGRAPAAARTGALTLTTDHKDPNIPPKQNPPRARGTTARSGPRGKSIHLEHT
jgi:hypothetical protein